MSGSQNDMELRVRLADIGNRLWQRGLVSGSDGNISARVGEEQILCTPSGVSKGFLEPAELVVTDLQGTAVASGKPSSELKMHLAIYNKRSDVRAIVHAHPPHATAFAIVQQPPPRYIMPEMEVLLGPIAVLPYRTPGTSEFADAFDATVHEHDVFILSNHGATTVGRSLEEAWFRMESLDQCCRMLLLASQVGKIKAIPRNMRPALEDQRKRFRS